MSDFLGLILSIFCICVWVEQPSLPADVAKIIHQQAHKGVR